MKASVDIEEIQTTRSEKLLAVVLAVFIAIGLIWGYSKLDEHKISSSVTYTAQQELVLHQRDTAVQAAFRTDAAFRDARQAAVDAREAYRTSLDAGHPDAALKLAYERATAASTAAGARADEAEAASQRAQASATAIERRHANDLKSASRTHGLWSFVFRLIYVLAFLAISFVVLDRTRQRRSRFLPAAASLLAASTLLAIVMAGDYLTDYIDLASLGPLVLSLFGIALSLTAFVALQRFLARHTPIRRVRKHECPYCGYPVKDNRHCEGCGREVFGTCASCQAPRRVGTVHCGSCGAGGAEPQ